MLILRNWPIMSAGQTLTAAALTAVYLHAQFYADPPRGGVNAPWLKLAPPDVALMQTPSRGCEPP